MSADEARKAFEDVSNDTDVVGAGGDAGAMGSPNVDENGDDEGLDAESVAALAAEADPRTREELYGALLLAEAQRDEYLDDLRRARAEFDNFRRRSTKDLSTQRDAGKADMAAALLETLDDLDLTLQAAEGSGDEQLVHGVRMVATKLLGALEQAGLERVDAVGVAFDPQVHEAVAQRPAEGGADDGPVVAEVMRPGYRWGTRVLRAAMVTVEQ